MTDKLKIMLPTVLLFNIGTLLLVVCYLFCTSFLNHHSISPKREGFIRVLEKQVGFFKALAYKESTGDHKVVNKFGYLGKYQFGEEALVTLGYYVKSGSLKNEWNGKWTGKHGVTSVQSFLNDSFVQELAMQELAEFNWKSAKIFGVDKFLGHTVHGVHVTREGILAGMHLKGPKGVTDFVFHGINSKDGLGTGVKDYMKMFAQYESMASV